MLSMLYSREAIERAKKRGRAYMCLMCETLTGEKRISELGPMEDHILKNHVSRDRVPFFCRLCTFKCQTRYQMEHHVRVYPRHKVAADQMGVTRDKEHEWMVESPAPYKIGDADMRKFSQEESILFFLRKQAGELMPNVRAPQMPAPTQYSNQMQMGNQLSAPITGGQPQQIRYSGNPSLFRPLVVNTSSTTLPLDVNSTAMWGSGQRLPISPMFDQTMLDQYLEDPVPNFSNQGTNQQLTSPQMFGASFHAPLRQPSPLPGGSLMRPVQPVGTAGQGTSNFNQTSTPAGQLTPSASLGNSLVSLGAIGASPGISNLAIPPMQPTPAAFQGNGTVGQSTMQVGQGTSNMVLTLPTPTTQTPPAVSLGNSMVNQSTIQAGQRQSSIGLTMPTPATQSSSAESQSTNQDVQGPSNSGLTVATPPVQSSPAVSLGNLSAGQGTFNMALITPAPTMPPTPTAPSRTVTPGIGEDSRQVIVGDEKVEGHTTEQTEDPFEDNVQEDVDGSECSGEVVEDLRPQLLESTETDYVSEAGLHYTKKRKNPTDAGRDERKKKKIETPGSSKSEAGTRSTVEISLVAMNGMVEALQNGTRQMARVEKTVEKTEKALTEITCMMGKVVDALTQFKNVMQESANEDRKREERWFDIERKREEERTREREAERRREDRRREAEKREREELRQLIKDALGAKNSKKEEEKENKDCKRNKEEKENKDGKRNKEEKGDVEDKGKKPVMKSVLERSYTENSMKDFSKKKSN